MNLRTYILILIAGFLISCSKDDPQPEISHLKLPTHRFDFQTIMNLNGQISSIQIFRDNTIYVRYDYEYEERKMQ
jgi:hypothetical protein